MFGKIPGTTTIIFCWFAWNTKIADQGFACCKFSFILRESDCLTCCIQSRCISTVQSMDHGTFPLAEWCFISGYVQTVPFKCCIIRMFYNLRIAQIFHYLVRYLFSLRQIYDLYAFIAISVCKQKNFKII